MFLFKATTIFCSRTRALFDIVATLAFSLTLAASVASAAPQARVLHVDNANPLAADTNDGDPARPFRTINAAAQLARAGDTVFVHAGVYREHVAPVRGGTKDAPLVFEAAPGHQVFVRGSEVWKPAWSPVENAPDVWSAKLDDALFSDAVRNPYRFAAKSWSNDEDVPVRPLNALSERSKKWLANKEPGRLPRTCGQLFVDGESLLEAETLAEVLRVPGTWLVDETGEKIIAHFPPSPLPPSRRLVELSARDRVFAPSRRGLTNIVVRGFVFEHAANAGLWPQLGMVSTRSGSRWLVENNIIRHAKTIGIDAGSEDYMAKRLSILALTDVDQRKTIIGRDNIIRNNTISDNGMCGLAAWHCHGIVIEGNRIERNNALEFKAERDHAVPWWEQAGVKLHAAIGARIEGNLFRDNHAHGIFIDNQYANARVTRNIILGSAGAGIMFELGHGPAVVDRNVVAFTRALHEFFGGDGIYGQDASGVTIAHNLLYSNIRHGVYFRHNENRKTGGKKASAAEHNRVFNNLIFDNAGAAINLPADGPTTAGNVSDYNIVSQRLARFIANQVPKTTPKNAPSVLNEFRRRLSPGGDAARVASRKDYSTWTLGDGLTLDEWRALTGRDTHSVIRNPKLIILRPATLEAEIFPGSQQLSTDYDSGRELLQETAGKSAEASGWRVPPVALPPGVVGAPLPAGERGSVIPGPWQFLQNHDQRFFLWPIPPETNTSALRAAPVAPATADATGGDATKAPKALPAQPEDLFRELGDTRPLRLVLNQSATIPANNQVACSYSDYQGGDAGETVGVFNPSTRELTLPPPPPAIIAKGGFVEISSTVFQNRIGVFYSEAAPPVPDEFFGVDSSFTWGKPPLTETLIRSYLEIMKRCGLLWNRDRFRWSALHPEESGAFDFDSINHTRYRRLASELGIHTLDTFHQTPEWLRASAEQQKITGANPYPVRLKLAAEDWGKIVRNFQPTLQALEVWNEPDLPGFGKNFPPDQAMSFTKAVSRKFRDAALETAVVGGVFANPQAGSVLQKTWLQNGLLDTCDAVSWHTYAPAETVERVLVAWRKLALQQNPVRAGLPVWITESGARWPWQRGMERAGIEGDIDVAAEITAKAAEYKALGVEKHFAFSYKFYVEPNNNKGYAMMDANHTPMRSIAAYATAAKTLAGLDYIGDLVGTNALRARIFAGADGRAVAVLYSPVSENGPPSPLFTFPRNLPLEKITGADGREITPGDTGSATRGDGIAYLHLGRKPDPRLLKTDTPAMEMLRLARDFKHRSEPRKTAPVVFQSMLDTRDVILSPFGYSLRNFAGKQFDVSVQNLSDTPQKIHPALELPDGLSAENFPGAELLLPPSGQATLSFKLTLTPAAAVDSFRILRVVDQTGHALPLALSVRAWRAQVKNVPALPAFPTPPAGRPDAKDWEDFSSPVYWTTWPGGEIEPTLQARFRAFHAKNLLRVQVLVHDENFVPSPSPENPGDTIRLVLQQHNPDGSEKKGARTVNVTGARLADGRTVLFHRTWNATQATLYKKSSLHFQELGDDWYLHTFDLDAGEMSLDASPQNVIGLSITVNSHSGLAPDGALGWGGGADPRFLNLLKLQ
ncbi:Glycosyl hydrolase catalytic core [Opitutaceae bacterium TAV1]|nr:Glycosyl hydrolase catalytic core [Opitutaceae bacterium TAV1]